MRLSACTLRTAAPRCTKEDCAAARLEGGAPPQQWSSDHVRAINRMNASGWSLRQSSQEEIKDINAGDSPLIIPVSRRYLDYICYVLRTLSPQDPSQLREFFERIIFKSAKMRILRYSDDEAHYTLCQFRKNRFWTWICRNCVLDVGGDYLSTSKACNCGDVVKKYINSFQLHTLTTILQHLGLP